MFLVRREFLFQLDGRRSHARGVYPGVSWFALLCVGAILLEFNSSRTNPLESTTVAEHFTLLALCQVALIGLRSTVYTALSFARDLQSHTATVVRVTPISRTGSLMAKLVACLAPLWCELLLFLPASLLFFSVYLGKPAAVVFSIFPFLFSVSLIGGCLGLLIGSMSPQATQAARNARLMVLFLLFFFPVLQIMSDGYFLPGMALGIWFLVAGRSAPHRIPIWGSLLVLEVFFGVTESWQQLQLSDLHPMYPIINFYTDALEGTAVQGPNPWTTGLVYAGLAMLCFALARLRYSHAR